MQRVSQSVEHWLEQGLIVEYAFVFTPDTECPGVHSMECDITVAQVCCDDEPQLSLSRRIRVDADDDEQLAGVIDYLGLLLQRRLLTPDEMAPAGFDAEDYQ